MLFNSFVFVGFFLVVYTAYVFFHRHYRIQNVILLVASYVFYGYWDWRFLSLIGVSTLVDFWAAQLIAGGGSPRARKVPLVASICTNLGILGFFKYFGFFAESFARLMGLLGIRVGDTALGIVLPVGISFYTFQTMSYTIDVYRGRVRPTRNLLDFALFVAFFPQLVAGPIERAANLLPQVSSARRITAPQVNAALYLLLQGYFKKVVVADNMALLADSVFADPRTYHGMGIVLGTLAFSAQIYCDFSGYSDIARGCAKLMGFELMVNFRLPYFARDPSEFWRRWHVSLSSWLRDYLYIPLGGSHAGKLRAFRNLAVTMVLGGLWHGAGWNFVVWGALHGGVLIGYHALASRSRPAASSGPGGDAWGAVPKVVGMFAFTCLGWIVFRSASLGQAALMVRSAGTSLSPATCAVGSAFLFFAVPLVALEFSQHLSGDLLFPAKLRLCVRAPVYASMLLWILVFGVREPMEFIYFQF
jgi:alginate O-acetyltransferase complex protein AlgI